MPRTTLGRLALVAGAIVGAVALPLGALAPAGAVGTPAPDAGTLAAAAAVRADSSDPSGVAGLLGGDGVIAPSLLALAEAAESAPTDEAPTDEAPNAAAGLAAGFTQSGPGSVPLDEQGRVAVSVRFSSAAAQQAAVPTLQSLGNIRSVTTSIPTVVVYLPTASFDDAAALAGVVSVAAVVRPRHAGASAALEASAAPAAAATPTAPASCRSIPVNSDAPLRADIARAAFGVDGTGVTVGILSNSFNALGPDNSAVSDEAQDIAAGSLPGPGNPCGYTTPVNVLIDDTPADDEGRAMAQTVHGIAPGATLLFAAAGYTEAEYADRIQKLADNGARVIVDDDVLPTEPWFQQGAVAQKIEALRAQGILYFSAAQNESSIGYVGEEENRPTGSWEADAYRPTDCPAAVLTWAAEAGVSAALDCNDFGDGSVVGAGPAELGVDFMVYAKNPATVALQWAEPADRVSTLLVPLLLQQVPGPPAADGTPGALVWETVGEPVLPDATKPGTLLSIDALRTGQLDLRVVVVRLMKGTEPAPTPRFKMIFQLDSAGVLAIDRAAPEGVTIGSTIFGHPTDPSVFTVGATSALEPTVMEPYSGIGPVQYYFGPVRADAVPAEPLADSRPHSKPDITSVDNPQTTFFNQLTETGAYYFGGTSAAAPNAAGVAALALQHSPQSSGDAVRSAFERTATPVPAQAWDYGRSTENWQGAGMINAYAVLAALPAAPTPVVPAGNSTRLADTGAPVTGELVLGALAPSALLGGLLLRRRRALAARA
ncbi:S8 family serine peptidase [Herbiconiux solani]|uniref:S8 family serine peptidase n=1 Tax=Herbiconiux solani TaxID=661329 RepID=UPI000AB1FD10|nr:S8 family serine peptidase [Herbiconiux solani]